MFTFKHFFLLNFHCLTYSAMGGPQMTSFDPKRMMSPTGGPKWPPLTKKELRHQREPQLIPKA